MQKQRCFRPQRNPKPFQHQAWGWAREAAAKATVEGDDGLGEGTKGLPLEWLNDPTKKAAFAAEQRARLERMNARLREVKLDVPHMTDKELKVNGRAMRVEEINA